MIKKILTNNILLIFLFFLILLSFNAKHLFDPPYSDGIYGLYTQGIWLFENNFDYKRLMTLPNFMEGGCNVNIYYGISFLYALLLKFIAAGKVYFIFHVANIFFSALAMTVAFKLLNKTKDLLIAFLWVITIAINPIWSVQTAGIYQEISASSMSLLALYFFAQKKHYMACLTCLIAFFLKSTAYILSVSWVIFFLFQWILNFRSLKFKKFIFKVIPYFVLFAALTQLSAVNSVVSRSFPFSLFFIKWFFYKAYHFFMLEFILFIIVLTGCVSYCLKIKSSWSLLKSLPDYFWPLLLSVGGFWFSYYRYSDMLPRYICFVLWPMAILISLLYSFKRKTEICIILFIIVYSMLNQYGLLTPAMPRHLLRSPSYLEINRKIFFDLQDNIELCQELEKKYYDRTIICTYPFVQMLSHPLFGYVKKPFPNIISLGKSPSIFKVKQLKNVDILPKDTLLIYHPSYLKSDRPSPLKPDDNDNIIISKDRIKGSTVVFERNIKL